MKKPTLTIVGPADNVAPPPRKLGKPGLALWRSIQSAYRVDDAGGVELLMQACEAADALAVLTRQLEIDGPCLRLKGGGVRDHPALRHIIAHRSFIVRTLARLGLNVEPARPHSGRPAGVFSWTGPEG